MTGGQWLISYDIACPKRLVRVHRFLKAESLPLQYSVFLAFLTEASLNRVLAGLAARIDPRRDDVRAYPLLADGSLETIGRPWIAEGLTAGTHGTIASPDPIQSAGV